MCDSILLSELIIIRMLEECLAPTNQDNRLHRRQLLLNVEDEEMPRATSINPTYWTWSKTTVFILTQPPSVVNRKARTAQNM